MSRYIKITTNKDSKKISLCFMIEEHSIKKIGEKMNTINENAYMNGYNWDAFLTYYLSKNYPFVLSEVESGSEPGSYVADFMLKHENVQRAEQLKNIIVSLTEDEDQIYEVLEREGGRIAWN